MTTPLSTAEFDTVRKLIYDRAGIALEDGKEYLVTTRLAPVARRFDVSLSELIDRVSNVRHADERDHIVDALTTNETSFFRDSHPFNALKDQILPDLIQRRAREQRLRILCAAASTGQEPYSIAMMIRENFPALITWDVQIDGVDISDTALAKATEGRFSQIEVNRGLPVQLLLRYFKQDGASFLIDDSLKKMVNFRKLNLVELWPPMGTYDVIMVRNVLIYFDVATKEFVLRQASKALAKDGYLFLGASETLLSIDVDLALTSAGPTRCYRHKAAIAQAA